MNAVILAYELPTENGHSRLEFPNLDELSTASKILRQPDGSYNLDGFRIHHYRFDERSELWAPTCLAREIKAMDIENDPELRVYASGGKSDPKIGPFRERLYALQKRLASNNFTTGQLIRREKRRLKREYKTYREALEREPYAFYIAMLDHVEEFAVRPIFCLQARRYMDKVDEKRREAFGKIEDAPFLVFSASWDHIASDIMGLYDRQRTMAPPSTQQPANTPVAAAQSPATQSK